MAMAWGVNGFSEREREVARLVAIGLTNAEIGEELFLSRHTVDFHIRQVFRKTGVHGRVQLTRVLLQDASSE